MILRYDFHEFKLVPLSMDLLLTSCQSTISSIVEDCLITVARRQLTTRFIKLHHEIAEMNHITAPALLAYKNGDVFATIVDILKQLPDGRDLSPSSLEELLMRYVFS